MKNGLHSTRKWLILIFGALWTSLVQGQPNLAFYPLNDQFNSSEFNPAFLTSREKFTFSIAPLAGMSLSYNHHDIIKEMATKFLSGVITRKEYEDIFNEMINRPSFYQNIEGSWLNFTYGTKAGFFNFRIKDREYLATSVRGEIVDFIFQMDIRSAAIGRTQHLPVESAHYREYSLGYSYTTKDKRLSAGARAKLYFGKFALYSDIGGTIRGLAGNYGLITNGLVNISFPESTIVSNDTTNTVDFSSKNIWNYFWNTGNSGIGVDLGLNYQLTPDVSVSLSVIDLGKIYWKSNLNSRSMDKIYLLPSTTFGIDTINGVLSITKRENYRYASSFDFMSLSRDSSSFNRALPMYLYAGVKYQVTPGLALSLTDRFAVIRNLSYNSLSLGASFNVNKKLSLNTGYTMIGDSYFNIPLALLFNQNFGQVYVGTDNLAALVIPGSDNYAAFTFGLSFYLFTHRNLLLKRSEYRPFYQPRKIIKNRGSGLIIKARKKEK